MNRPCPICRNAETTVFRVAHPLALRTCSKCSVVYMGPASDVESYFEDVEREYFGEGYLRKRNLFADWFHCHKARCRLKVIRRYKLTGRLLDIGCGGGDLLVEARNVGYKVVGLEFSATLAAHVRQRHGLDVHVGEPKSFHPTELFDVVVMSHVIEHVAEPLEMLRSVRKLLAPGGILYVATPNVACWEAHFNGWASYEPYHLSYFSPLTLHKALERTGYQVINVHTWEPLSAWWNTAIRDLLGERYLRARLAVQHDKRGVSRPRWWIVVAGLNLARFTSGLVLTPLRLLQERLLRGEELICIAVLHETM